MFEKLIEKVMCNRLKLFLKKNNILYKYQFGFRENHSTDFFFFFLLLAVHSLLLLPPGACRLKLCFYVISFYPSYSYIGLPPCSALMTLLFICNFVLSCR